MTAPAASRYRLIPILLTQVVGFACGLASIRLNSRLIPPAVLGFYGLFLTVAPIGMWVVNAGLLKFISRHWAGAIHKHAVGREVLGLWLRRLPWVALLTGLAAWTLLSTPGTSPVLVWLLLFLTAGLLALAALAQNALGAVRAHWRDFAVTGSGAVLRSFAPPLLYSLWPVATSLLLGFSLHATVAALAGLWAVHSLLGRKTDGDPAATTLDRAYEGPLFTALAISSWMVGSMNRWLVAWRFGDHEAGYFTLIGGAAVIITSMLGTVLVQYLQPGLFALGDGPATQRPLLARRVDLAALAYALSAGLALAGANLVLPSLVGPLISPTYREALVWLVPAGCFGIASFIAVFYHIMLLAGRRENACAPVDLTTAALLALGGVLAALAGATGFARWLMITPLVPLLVTRTLARHYFFKPSAGPAPSPAR